MKTQEYKAPLCKTFNISTECNILLSGVGGTTSEFDDYETPEMD